MKKSYGMALLATLCILSACKKENDTDPEKSGTPLTPANMQRIGETWISGAQAKAYIYTTEAPFAGFNRLYVLLTDSADGSVLTDGHFSVAAHHTTTTQTDEAPVENSTTTSPVNGYYQGSVFFTAPGNTGWKLHLHFHNHKNNKEGEGEIGLAVAARSPERIIRITAADSSIYYLSYLQPASPRVGMNDLEFVLHRKEGNGYLAITDHTIEIDPEMIGMTHGSPNNVNPVHTSIGHYQGKVNFTMTGQWRIHIKLRKNGVLLNDQAYFDLSL